MKPARACQQCRDSKRRCRRAGLCGACDTCRRRGVACDGVPRRWQRTASGQDLLPWPVDATSCTLQTGALSITTQPTTLETQDGLDLPMGIAVELVEHYLDRVNNGRPHSLFHRRTLRGQVEQSRVKKPLLYAIYAVGARFSANPDVRAWEPRLLAEAKRLLQLGLEDVCLEHIQACILITTMCVDSSNSSEALFHRIASAMADIMKLNSVETQDITSLIQAESRRRTWWTLYLADNWCVSGLGMLSPTSHGVIAIDLPMDEADFQALHVDEQVPSRNGPCHTGSFAQIVLLSRLFSPIQDLNRQVAAQDSARGTNLDHEVEVLSQKLEEWTGQLPPDMGMSWENLHQHQERGSGGSFVVMHLAYHYYGTLLYFRFLEDHKHHRPGSTSLPETTHGATAITLMYGSTYVHRCRSHASQFSTLLRRARQLRGCEPMFPLVGHMTTVSSAVLLYTLLFSHEEHKLGRARDELQANFEALVELKRYWPATAAMITRLVRFQETCLLWSEEEEEGGGLAGTHRLDGWMLRFLLERSLAGEGGSS